MLVKPLIIKHLTTTLIGPHGITDIIHANNSNLLPQMSATYGSTVGSSILLHHFHMEPMLDIAFFIASIIHFRRDMPYFKPIPRYALSTSLLMFSYQYCPELFIFYMLSIHVPHHYQMNWEFMKQTPKFSILLIVFTSITMGFIGNSMDILENTDLLALTKGIIISHIFYEELFIFNIHNSIKN
ncbi:MAG: hypothetical protein CBB97_26430 [Candidatus Endolissoclinum sp. TMED37]|nr:MAG: hypothetical protein CBB97_26430 [Candidatus Endolissoclinum sp. TMED37]